MATTKKDKPSAPVKENPTRTTEAKKTLQEQNRDFVTKLKKEKKVKVLGNELYKTHQGDALSFLYNGIPVYLPFDGEYHIFPETLAKVIERKLKLISIANTPKRKNVKI